MRASGKKRAPPIAWTGDVIADLALLSAPQRLWAFAVMTEGQRAELAQRWAAWAHKGQTAPEGDWRVWLIRAGRGFGKTRSGAEWVSDFARAHPDARIALVGDTADDVASVMIEGTSGLITVARHDEDVTWKRDRGELFFPSGAVARVFSANAPEGLRGPEHDAAWCDELAKWKNGDAAWDNLMMGMRRGERPRVIVTTTPRPNALMRRVMAMPGVVETRGSTRDNPHLAPSFVADMETLYAGTRLGRQELDGEMVDDVAGALWTRAMIEASRTAQVCDAVRVVVGSTRPLAAPKRARGAGDAGAGERGVVRAKRRRPRVPHRRRSGTDDHRCGFRGQAGRADDRGGADAAGIGNGGAL